MHHSGLFETGLAAVALAAWLAYLKSRLLLPPDPEEEGPSDPEATVHD